MGEYEQVGVVIAFMGPIIHGLHAADTGMFVGFGAMIHLAAHAPAPRVEVLREIGLQVCAGSASNSPKCRSRNRSSACTSDPVYRRRHVPSASNVRGRRTQRAGAEMGLGAHIA